MSDSFPPEATPPEETPREETPPPQVECWRCRRAVDADASRCPFCSAQLSVAPAETVAVEVARESKLLMQTFTAFTVLLLTSIVYGVAMRSTAEAGPADPAALPLKLLTHMVILGAINSAIVIASLLMIPVPRSPTASLGRRVAGYALALPLLALVLACNFAYHWAVHEALGVKPVKLFGGDPGLRVWWILVVCVQPAIFEELFFRYVAFNPLEKLMGGHGAVFATSVMFGLAHVGSPISIPMLVVLGITLGYARLIGGTIWIPVLMHFLHNAAVLAWEWM